jgi:non-ribosomal peptide synthetase component F
MLDRLSTLSLPDRLRFALYGVATAVDSTRSRIHEVFSSCAQQIPQSVASSHLGTTLTYKELDETSNCFSLQLRSHGIGRGSRVCLLIQRSHAMLVGIFGILKAGASYVPLDGGMVTDKMLKFVLKDSGAAMIVHSAAYSHRIPPQFKSICVTECIESQKVERNQRSSPFILCAQDNMPSNEAYVIYTSGKC